MKLRTITIAAAILWALPTFADEGMWLPSLISERIADMQSKGLKLTAEDLYSVNHASLKDAIVLFGSGCTGELVSDEGLLFTNHHCGYGYIQKHSSVEHDYLKDGFWAMNRAQELPNPGLTVKFLERMEDVTSAVMKGAYITYSNDAKVLHGVPKETIDKYGVYSYETAEDMAFSAGAIYEADVAIGVTGTMGNTDPSNDDSVPGEVYFAIASKFGNRSYHANIPPKHSRYEYKLAVAELVADKLIEIIGK